MVSYADEKTVSGDYDVTYIVNETGAKLTRSFDDALACLRFVNKLKHSKRCTLIAYPFFD